MKHLVFLLLMSLFVVSAAQTVKSKNLKIKYTPPAGWNAEEFGDKSPWETGEHTFCKCAGAHFFKSHKEGKMHVVIYASTQSGLDSSKRNGVGELRFEDVIKFDRVRNKGISFERKKSGFTDTKTNKASFEAYRYFTKIDDRYYIIYAWQENMQTLNSTNEKEIFDMVNAIEMN